MKPLRDKEQRSSVWTKVVRSFQSEQEPVCVKDCAQEACKPVTVFAKNYPRADKIEAFEQWSTEMNSLMRHYEGYLETEMIRPISDENEFIAIFRFDNFAHLQAWMDAPERQRMIDRIPEFAETDSKVYTYNSLEHWFSAGDDDKKGAGPPSKYKMVIVTTGIIYAQLFFVPDIYEHLAPGVKPDVRSLITTFSIVVLSTFVWFPLVTRLLAFWLFPTASYKEKLLELVPSALRQNRERTAASSSEHKDTPSETTVPNSV